MFLTDLLWIGYENITKLNQSNVLSFEPDKHSTTDQSRAENLDALTQQTYDYIEEYENKIKGKEFSVKYGFSKGEQQQKVHSDIDITALWKTDQKSSKNIRSDKENPLINTRTTVETKQPVDGNNSIQELKINYRNSNGVSKTVDLINTQSSKSKRSTQTEKTPQIKRDLYNGTSSRQNYTEHHSRETNPLENKRETFREIVNDFYRSSITYMWHFLENPTIFEKATSCISYLDVDICDLRLELMEKDHIIYKHIYFVPDTYTKTKINECIIAFNDGNRLNLQGLCSSISPANFIKQSSFDTVKFLEDEKSLLEITFDPNANSNNFIKSSTIIIRSFITEEFKFIYNLIYEKLAEKNATYANFIPKNPRTLFILSHSDIKRIAQNRG